MMVVNVVVAEMVVVESEGDDWELASAAIAVPLHSGVSYSDVGSRRTHVLALLFVALGLGVVYRQLTGQARKLATHLFDYRYCMLTML